MTRLDQFTLELNNFISKIPGITPILINIILGLLVLFLGYRLYRYWLFIIGMQFGNSIASLVAKHLSLKPSAELILTVVLIVASGLLYWSSMRFSFALAGFSVGSLFAKHYGSYLTKNPDSFFIIVCGLICGVLAYFFVKHSLIIGTSAYGALISADSLYALATSGKAFGFTFNKIEKLGDLGEISKLPLIFIALTLVMMGIGILVQRKLSRKGALIRTIF